MNLTKVIELLLTLLPKNFLKTELRNFLNNLKVKIEKSPNKFDDLALPLINRILDEL